VSTRNLEITYVKARLPLSSALPSTHQQGLRQQCSNTELPSLPLHTNHTPNSVENRSQKHANDTATSSREYFLFQRDLLLAPLA
jgi:hypothetical protein